MSNHDGLVEGLETRSHWAEEVGAHVAAACNGDPLHNEKHERLYALPIVRGEFFFMNAKFATLVDHARRTIPDELEFEEFWVPTKDGFIWIETPFDTPAFDSSEFEKMRLPVRAIGWFKMESIYQFTAYFQTQNGGYTGLCFFYLRQGEKVLDRVRYFENITAAQGYQGTYVPGRECDMLHEIRWVYTALHLMSQRLAVTIENPTPRPIRRRADRDGRTVKPTYRLVSLRRLEEERETHGESAGRDWSCHWQVHGHWRQQPYGIRRSKVKPVFIESYIKGDLTKPLKETDRIFVAGR